MTRRSIAVLLALLSAGLVGPARTVSPASAGVRASASRLANASEVRRRLGLDPEYRREAGVEAVKVAVLDFGFDGLGSGRAYLPEGSVLVEHYDPDFVRRFDLGDPEFRKGFEPGNTHGRQMAQIIWAISGGRPGGPRFYLLNAN